MDLPITVRQMQLEFPSQDEFDPIWLGGNATASYFSLGLSLYLPYLEPFLVKALRRAAPEVTDPSVAENLDKFCRQEAQHYKQHERFNELIHARDYPGLAEIEARCAADFERFLNQRPMKFSVGFVEGFESYTTQLASGGLNNSMYDGPATSQKIADLFRWHLTEEIEHRTVAYDIYEHLYGDYLYRVKMCWIAQFHVGRFVWETATLMSRVDSVRHGARYRISTPVKLLAMTAAFAQFLITYLPNYSPYKLKVSPRIKELAEHYSGQAAAIG